MPESKCKLFFDLGQDQWHGFRSESVNATKVWDQKYRLENSPFFAKGVSYKDIVAAEKVKNRLIFVDTILSSGHSTYHVLLKDKMVKPQEWLIYWDPLEEIGCSYEENRELALTMLAIDVPSGTNIREVYKLLELGERAGVWEFEEGHCGHFSV